MKDFNLNFMHLCDDAIFSQEGKLSLIGIFEVINLQALPGSLLKAFVVFNLSVLNKAIKKVELDIVIRKTDTKKEILKLPTLIPPMVTDVSKLGFTLQLNNIIFQEIGKYIIELNANKTTIGTLEFDVKLQVQKGAIN